MVLTAIEPASVEVAGTSSLEAFHCHAQLDMSEKITIVLTNYMSSPGNYRRNELNNEYHMLRREIKITA